MNPREVESLEKNTKATPGRMGAAASFIGEIKEHVEMQLATLYATSQRHYECPCSYRERFTDLQVRQERDRNPRMRVLEG